MADIAKHIRIFNPNPDDDFVTKRTSAIALIEAAVKKKVNNMEIFLFANGLIKGIENSNVANSIINEIAEPALKKYSTSFVADGEELQLLTCALIGTIQYLEKYRNTTGKSTPEVILAGALWSGLSFQSPLIDKEKLEALRLELLTISAQLATEVAYTSRNRKEIKPRTALSVPTDETIASLVASIESIFGKQLDSMRTNAILDSEEINILWWVLNGWSNICKIPIHGMNSVQTALISGLEISALLQRFPAEAFANLACKGLQINEQFTGPEIIQQLGDLAPVIVAYINENAKMADYSLVTPVFSLLTANDSSSGNSLGRPIHEWASRILFEGSLINVDKFVE